MTEQEFKQKLDAVVIEGINEIGAGVVLGALAIVTRFTEVMYDNNIMNQLTQAQAKAQTEAATGSTDDGK